MRAAIYARFSTDKQSEASAADQARICRELANREGWAVTATFEDLAISGATRDRPGLNQLLERAGEFDVVIAEAIDRISRDQEDIAAIFKRLRFAGARLVTTSEGEISELHVGLKGTMSALFLKDLADKTRRGQIGRVAKGRIPGGLSYGYERVLELREGGDPERGVRRIREDQAAVIRRIFKLFVAGASPRAIAQLLNGEGIPSPMGKIWRTSTIAGSRSRRNGILHNELYAGRIVYNRQSFRKDPETRKRIGRLNPPSEWKIAECPELRIVDEETWTAAIARLDRHAGRPAHVQRRPKRLFSGLLVCGECGGNYIVMGKGKWGCGGRREGSGCGNNRTIENGPLERRILGAMSDSLLAPDAVQAFVSEYHLTIERDRKKCAAERGTIERRHSDAAARVQRLAAAIADGAASFAEIRGLMDEAAAERDRLARELADMDVTPVIALHPGIADAYRRALAELSIVLEGPAPRRSEARSALRSLLDRVTVQPKRDGRGVELEVHGRLAAMIALAQKRPLPEAEADRMIKMVAGAGFGRNHTIVSARA